MPHDKTETTALPPRLRHRHGEWKPEWDDELRRDFPCGVSLSEFCRRFGFHHNYTPKILARARLLGLTDNDQDAAIARQVLLAAQLTRERAKLTTERAKERDLAIAQRDTDDINRAAEALGYRYGGPFSVEEHQIMRKWRSGAG